MVLLKMLMEIALPKMVELLVMMMTMISPFGREVPLAESLRRSAKVLLPKFRLEMAALHPESSPLIVYLGKNDLYTRRWAPEVGLVSTTLLGSLARTGGLCPLGGAPLVLICSNIPHIFHKNSA